MKVRIAVLPLLVFAFFGYTVSVAERASDHATKPIEMKTVKEIVKHDFSKFKPSDKFVYNS